MLKSVIREGTYVCTYVDACARPLPLYGTAQPQGNECLRFAHELVSNSRVTREQHASDSCVMNMQMYVSGL